jgi:hypothetical protein
VHHKHSKLLLLFLYFFTVISVVATVRVNAASFQLTWVDNSQNEDGFNIERKLGTTGTFSLLATVGPNVTSYSDNNLADSTTYCYRLNAFNSAGNSAYTNDACETTPATFDFSLSNGGNKSVTQGQSITNAITATLTTGSSQEVSFSTPGLLPSGATASYTTSTSCNPTCSRTLNIATAASTPAGSYTIMVTGTSGGLTRTTNFTLTVNSPTPTFDFSLSNDGSKSVTPGQSIASTITATLSSGSPQAVSFSTAGLPSGATASYATSTSCIPTCSRTLNIVTAASTPTGTSSITVTSTGGGVTRTTSFTLTVNSPTRSISTNIADGAVLSGSSVVWTATPTGSPVRVEFFIDGALLWTANTAPYQFNGDPSGTLNTNTLSNGSHQLKVRAIYSDNTTAELTVTITASNGTPPPPVFDFSLTNGGNKSVTQGQSLTNTVTATLSSGSSQSVSFSTSGLPSGATASYTTSNSCTPTCSRTLNIATAASTPTGTHMITVTGTGGGATKTTNFSLTVNSRGGSPPPATYTLNATPSTVQAGETITISWTAPSGSSSTDWISLYATGAANSSFGWWQYTNGATSGSVTVPAPSTAGTYEFRYLLNDGYTSVKQSTIINVTP